jgi:hypothetical protein
MLLEVFQGVANLTGWILKGPCHTARNSDAKLETFLFFYVTGSCLQVVR